MTLTRSDQSALGATVLRVSLGGLFLAHAALKVFVFTPAGTAQFFEKVGVPGPVAYLTILAELVIGLLLVSGLYTRLAALAGIPILLGAIATVHAGNGFFFDAPGGGWEFPAMWAVALLAQALLGGGAYALQSPRGAADPALAV